MHFSNKKIKIKKKRMTSMEFIKKTEEYAKKQNDIAEQDFKKFKKQQNFYTVDNIKFCIVKDNNLGIWSSFINLHQNNMIENMSIDQINQTYFRGKKIINIKKNNIIGFSCSDITDFIPYLQNEKEKYLFQMMSFFDATTEEELKTITFKDYEFCLKKTKFIISVIFGKIKI